MRKLFLLAAALILAALPAVPAAAAPVEDASTTTPIKHVVWMMQDNHSFDNYFGTYPGADGIPSGVCQRVNLNRLSTRGCVPPFHIGDAPVEDLSQGQGIQRRQYNGGRMDGFVAAYRRLGQDGSSAMGYYDGSDIPFHWNAADQYVLFDRFFASTAVGNREAYLYWVAGKAPAGQTLRRSAGYEALPTIFDRLAERQIPARFYVENLDAATTRGGSGVKRSSQLIKVPLLNMQRFREGGNLAGQVVDLSQYYLDLRNGTLPAVSYIVTTGSSENPPGGLEAGSRTLRKVTSELMKSSSWSTSALMWTYDGWGGWYDHVTPPRVDSRGYGFRVPALLVSPYAKKGVVDHTFLDYTAMLHFIETNWQLAPLSTRDKQSAGLASAFDFTAAPRPATLLPWTWPSPQMKLASHNPAPVIYSVYGVAAALAIAVVSVAAFRGRPITVPVPVARAAVLVRSRFESVRGGMQLFLWGTRWPTPAASGAAPPYAGDGERPARFYQVTKQAPKGSPDGQILSLVGVGAAHQERADQSDEISDPNTGDGEVSVLLPGAQPDAEIEAQAATAADATTTSDAEVATAVEATTASDAEVATEVAAVIAAEPATAAEAEVATEVAAVIAAEPATAAEAEAAAEAAAATEARVRTATAAPTAPRRRPRRRRNPNRRWRR